MIFFIDWIKFLVIKMQVGGESDREGRNGEDISFVDSII